MTPLDPGGTLKGFEEVWIFYKHYLYEQELKTTVCLVPRLWELSPWFLSTQPGDFDEGNFSSSRAKTLSDSKAALLGS